MADNMKYWSNVFKKVFYVILSIIGIYLGYKFAIFYMPFLIAFIISTIMEPAIRFLMKKFNFKKIEFNNNFFDYIWNHYRAD